MILEPVHHSTFGLTHILFGAPCALQTVDQVRALTVHIVFCDILPSSGGRDDFSTPIHFRAISALRIIACVHRAAPDCRRVSAGCARAVREFGPD